ncbi:tRNA-(ms[2]io[6]A)-hydroxylase [bacterium]|nr:tRNA-(ms[2]io[6]A)-hydroxylase [bacterium]
MKTTLGLELATDPRWADINDKSIEFILTDHAWCEQKAASTGISLISRFSDYSRLVQEVSPVVAEEWGHFRKVLKELKKRGFELGLQRKDEYVNKLKAFAGKGGSREGQLIEYLLMMAMIEARSCERFKILSENLKDPDLRSFYREFMISEAGHYRMFLDLAIHYSDEETALNRWKEWLAFESEMIQTLELRSDRIH